jgi:3-deoxy-D-manno-octulosonic-acid transferase
VDLVLYNISVWFYRFALQVAAPFNVKAAQMLNGRKNLMQTIVSRMQDNTSPVAWFHCASLGEFEQGRPVMEAFARQFPHYKIVLTFFSPSGFEIRKNYEGAHYIFYLPFDSAANANGFIEAVKPTLAIFIKYEFWHHYLSRLSDCNIPVFSVSAIFRPDQHFFKPYGGFYRKMLSRFTHIFTQNQQSAELLQTIGINQVTVAGDTRFDRVLQTAGLTKMMPMIERFLDNRPAFVIGSSWPEDMKVLLPFIKRHIADYKFIIAPHEIQEKDILMLLDSFEESPTRYSQAEPWGLSGHQVIVIDNIGMLSSVYKYAAFTYIGGAFGRGLHNILEAAAFGSPLFFGPDYDRFQEAKDLVALGCAFPVRSASELENRFSAIAADPAATARIRQRSVTYVNENAGATSIILNHFGQLLNPQQT